MSRLNDPENFAGRVNYAAKVISAGRRTDGRAFDNCFENGDGDVVAAALMRRAANNPKIAANIFRFLNEQIVRKNVASYAALTTRELPIAAATARAASKARWNSAFATREESTNA
jgi:hypothetical protein